MIEQVAAELLDGGAMEMVEGTRIVELLVSTPLAAARAPGDALREVPPRRSVCGRQPALHRIGFRCSSFAELTPCSCVQL